MTLGLPRSRYRNSAMNLELQDTCLSCGSTPLVASRFCATVVLIGLLTSDFSIPTITNSSISAYVFRFLVIICCRFYVTIKTKQSTINFHTSRYVIKNNFHPLVLLNLGFVACWVTLGYVNRLGCYLESRKVCYICSAINKLSSGDVLWPSKYVL